MCLWKEAARFALCDMCRILLSSLVKHFLPNACHRNTTRAPPTNTSVPDVRNVRTPTPHTHMHRNARAAEGSRMTPACYIELLYTRHQYLLSPRWIQPHSHCRFSSHADTHILSFPNLSSPTCSQGKLDVYAERSVRISRNYVFVLLHARSHNIRLPLPSSSSSSSELYRLVLLCIV